MTDHAADKPELHLAPLAVAVRTLYGDRPIPRDAYRLIGTARQRRDGLPDRRTREGRQLTEIYRRVEAEAREEFERGTAT